MNNNFLRFFFILSLMAFSYSNFALAQSKISPMNTAVKLNAAVVVGVLNPAVEFRVHKYISLQMEVMGVFYPEKTLWSDAPLTLGAAWLEARYYPVMALDGFFVGPNVGFGVFRLSKGAYPLYPNAYKNQYQVGSNFMAGLTLGYQLTFCKHWAVEVSFGGGYQLGVYEGHNKDNGSMYIGLNKSAEWLPVYKGALNIIYKW